MKKRDYKVDQFIIDRGLIGRIVGRRWNVRETYERRNQFLEEETLDGAVKRLNFK